MRPLNHQPPPSPSPPYLMLLLLLTLVSWTQPSHSVSYIHLPPTSNFSAEISSLNLGEGLDDYVISLEPYANYSGCEHSINLTATSITFEGGNATLACSSHVFLPLDPFSHVYSSNVSTGAAGEAVHYLFFGSGATITFQDLFITRLGGECEPVAIPILPTQGSDGNLTWAVPFTATATQDPPPLCNTTSCRCSESGCVSVLCTEGSPLCSRMAATLNTTCTPPLLCESSLGLELNECRNECGLAPECVNEASEWVDVERSEVGCAAVETAFGRWTYSSLVTFVNVVVSNYGCVNDPATTAFVTVESDSSFVFEGGGLWSAHTRQGSALVAATEATLHFVDTSIHATSGRALAGVSGATSSVFVDRTSVADSVYQVGVMAGMGASLLSLVNSSVENCTASHGGGVITSEDTVLVLISSVSVTNTRGSAGGALFLSGGSALVTDADFLSTSAEREGGVLAVHNAHVELISSSLEGGSSEEGGCIYLNASRLSVSLSTLKFCTANGGSGGGLYLGSSSVLNVSLPLTVENCEAALRGGGLFGEANSGVEVGALGGLSLSGNVASLAGGGAYVDGGSLAMASSAFVVANSNVARECGGIILVGSHNLSTVVVLSNTAVNGTGGGLCVEARSTPTTLVVSTLLMALSNRADGASGHGGGLSLGSDVTVSVLTGSLQCRWNNAGGNGGGLWMGTGAGLVVKGSAALALEHNSARRGGALWMGGTTSILSANSTVEASFVSNIGGDYGGALYVSSGGGLTLTFTRFGSNQAVLEGSAIYVEPTSGGPVPALTNAIFEHNNAWQGGTIVMETGLSAIMETVSFVANAAGGVGGSAFLLRGALLTASSVSAYGYNQGSLLVAMAASSVTLNSAVIQGNGVGWTSSTLTMSEASTLVLTHSIVSCNSAGVGVRSDGVLTLDTSNVTDGSNYDLWVEGGGEVDFVGGGSGLCIENEPGQWSCPPHDWPTLRRICVYPCPPCVPEASCNTITRDCDCNAGYIGNHTFCADINECPLTVPSFGLDNPCGNPLLEECFNTIGSFTCVCRYGAKPDGTCKDFLCGDGIVSGREECDVALSPGSCTSYCYAHVGGCGGQLARDCAGTCNGFAVVDTCGICAGGRTGVLPDADTDLCGQCYGSLEWMDDCGVCNGSNADMDACGVCFGDSSSCWGCDRVPNSGAVVDQCGICGGNGTTCLGCNGLRMGAGGATFDECGVCGGPGGPCAFDCAGTPGGTGVFDCARECQGTASIDTCGVCTGGSTGLAPNYHALPCGCFDACDICTEDDCGICGGDSSTCEGCDGTVGGPQFDLCGVCGGSATQASECVFDCEGVPGGSKAFDCAGVCGGAADLDSCGVCTGGSTNLPPDFHKDFCGVCFGGDSSRDLCGVCNGGEADRDTCGVCFGANADLDDCGECFRRNRLKDLCGVCNGNSSSCIGCDGIPNGRTDCTLWASVQEDEREIVSDSSRALIAGLSVSFVSVAVLLIAFVLYLRKRRFKDRIAAYLAAKADEAPRGTVTFVFTDIQGSTELWEERTEAMRGALDLHHRLIRSLLADTRGYEVKTEGDAFMATFQDPLDAVHFCLRAQVELLSQPWPANLLTHAAAARELAPSGRILWVGPRVRMGIHTGVPDLSFDERSMRMDYYGSCVNLAARVSGIAHGGQVFMSSAAVEACGGQVFMSSAAVEACGTELAQRSDQWELKLEGDVVLKGVKEPVAIYQIAHVTLAERSFPRIGVDNDTHRSAFASTARGVTRRDTDREGVLGLSKEAGVGGEASEGLVPSASVQTVTIGSLYNGPSSDDGGTTTTRSRASMASGSPRRPPPPVWARPAKIRKSSSLTRSGGSFGSMSRMGSAFGGKVGLYDVGEGGEEQQGMTGDEKGGGGEGGGEREGGYRGKGEGEGEREEEGVGQSGDGGGEEAQSQMTGIGRAFLTRENEAHAKVEGENDKL